MRPAGRDVDREFFRVAARENSARNSDLLDVDRQRTVIHQRNAGVGKISDGDVAEVHGSGRNAKDASQSPTAHGKAATGNQGTHTNS